MESIGLSLCCFLSLLIILYLKNFKKKNQLQKVFVVNSFLLFAWCALLLGQKYFCSKSNIDPIKFEYFIYVCACFLPVSIFFTGIIFANTKITFKKRYILYFIIPIISLLILWTNNYHHLFYVHYSTNLTNTVFGNYFIIHTIYTYALYFLGAYFLIIFISLVCS